MTDFNKVWAIIGEDIQNIADDCGGSVPAAQLRIIIEEKVGVDPRTYLKYSDMLVRHKKLTPIGTKGLLFKFFDGKMGSESANLEVR